MQRTAKAYGRKRSMKRKFANFNWQPEYVNNSITIYVITECLHFKDIYSENINKNELQQPFVGLRRSLFDKLIRKQK